MKRTPIALLILLAPPLAACSGGGDNGAAPAAETITITETSTEYLTKTQTVTVTPEPPAASELRLKPRDFEMDVKVTSKECFGSAGCNVGYTVEPTYLGAVADLKGVSIDITYSITGAESEIIGTISLQRGRYDVPDGFTSTNTESAVLEATVTAVDVY